MTDTSLDNLRSPGSLFPPGAEPVPGSVHERYVEDRTKEAGRWGTDTLALTIAKHAVNRGDVDAFIEGDRRMTWRDYHNISRQLAGALIASGLQPEERVAVMMPDGPAVHAAYVACEKAGVITVGIGPRAGSQEIRHLLNVTGATALVTVELHRGQPMAELVAALRAEGLVIHRHFVIDEDNPSTLLLDGRPIDGIASGDELDRIIAERRRRIGDIFMLNSTSGTTGMPKCVVHAQNRWRYYHTLAMDAGQFTESDVFMALIPAPFGFSMWTCHFSPSLVGCPTVVMSRFTAAGAIELIEREKVSVLACVSTQFIMMLNSDAIERHDVSSLRCMFTGGEAIPFDRAREFETRTGAKVVQFYGSNETGTLSYCGVADTFDERLRTSGRVVEEMNVRLYDDDRNDVTAQGGPGQSGCSGPATCLGYYADPEANEKLFTPDGSMLTGDVCVISDKGFLTIVDRKSDFIIRGGKNVSAAAVEEQVGSHPTVLMTAAVAMPDPVYGERVCAYVVLREGTNITLDELKLYLDSRGVSHETWPERLEIVEELPMGSGGKVIKGPLREDIRKKLADEAGASVSG